MTHARNAALAILLGAGGCGQIVPGAGFSDVERATLERTGAKVRWNSQSDEDKAAEKMLKDCLGGEMGIEDAVQVALLNNQRLQATYESLGIAQADLVQAGLIRNPLLDAQVRFHGAGPSIEAEVVQDFMSILFIPLRKKVAAGRFEATKLAVTASVLELAGEVREAYVTMQAGLQLLELRETVLQGMEASFDLARRLNEAGNTTDLDLANERALYEEAKLDRRRAELDVITARERLNSLMGLWGKDTSWNIPNRLPKPPPEEPTLEGIEAKAVASSLELAAAKAEFASLAAALGIAGPLAIFPEAGLGVSAERDTDGSWGFGPAVSLPLPFFNQGQAAIAAARSELARSRERFVALAVELRSETRDAGNEVIAAKGQAEHYEKVILPLRRKIVAETQIQYNAMLLGAFQLLFAKQQEVEAGSRYVESLRDYWLARNRLDQLLNGHMREGDKPAMTRMMSGGKNGNRGSDRGGE